MSSTRTKRIHTVLTLAVICLMPVAGSGADYPPPPGLYRPLNGAGVPDEYRSKVGQDRRFGGDRSTQPAPPTAWPDSRSGDTAVTAPSPQASSARPTRTGERAPSVDRYLPDPMPRFVPGYAPPPAAPSGGTPPLRAPARDPVTSSSGSYRTPYPDGSLQQDRSDAPQRPPASGAGRGEYGAAIETHRPATPAVPAYGDRPGRRFRPPGAAVSSGSESPPGNEPSSQYSPPRPTPQTHTPPAPRSSGPRGAYDSRFRPPGPAE